MGEGFLEAFHETFWEALDEGLPIALAKLLVKTMPNQEQEQEQEIKITDVVIERVFSDPVILAATDTSAQSSKIMDASLVFDYWKLVMNHPRAKFAQIQNLN